MSARVGEGPPSETVQGWDTVRRVREPVAWTLLALTAIILLVSACQLFNLAGAKVPGTSPARAVPSAVPVPVGSSPAPIAVGSSPAPSLVGSSPAPGPVGPNPVLVSTFALRASLVAPQFIDALVQALPVLAVILVSFSGGLTECARQVVQTATAVLGAAFVLGVISLAGAAGARLRPGTWFIFEAAGLAITATALILTGAVLWSRPLRSLAPRFPDLGDDEDVGEHTVDFAEDAVDFGEPD
jgi:hypothetical protein